MESPAPQPPEPPRPPAGRPPFRADHVGSLLRPPEVLRARDDFAAGRIGAGELRGIEDAAIREVVRMQQEVGLRSATDGEFRRESWHMDFIYQLGGIRKVQDDTLRGAFHNDHTTLVRAPPSPPVAPPLALDPTLFGRAADLGVTTHMCGGNNQSMWGAEGGYDFVAEALFNELDVDGFFCEWDDERSGGFEPLRFVPKGKRVVLGLVTTKHGQPERKDDLKRRIEDAARFVDGDQLCLSPQCGFSSTKEGNDLTQDQQWAKLALIVETAQEVWDSP